MFVPLTLTHDRPVVVVHLTHRFVQLLTELDGSFRSCRMDVGVLLLCLFSVPRFTVMGCKQSLAAPTTPAKLCEDCTSSIISAHALATALDLCRAPIDAGHDHCLRALLLGKVWDVNYGDDELVRYVFQCGCPSFRGKKISSTMEQMLPEWTTTR